MPALLTSTSTRSKLPRQRTHDPLAGVGGGDVQGERLDAPACPAALVGDLGQRLLAPADEQDRGPLACERHGGRPPDPARCPRDRTRAALQTKVHGPDSYTAISSARRSSATPRSIAPRDRFAKPSTSPGAPRPEDRCQESPSTPQREHEQPRGDSSHLSLGQRARQRLDERVTALAVPAAARSRARRRGRVRRAREPARSRRAAWRSRTLADTQHRPRRRRLPKRPKVL